MFKIVCDGCGAEVTPAINRVGEPVTPSGWSLKIPLGRNRVLHACSDKCQDKIDENDLGHEKNG